jgi:hypothetical protein
LSFIVSFVPKKNEIHNKINFRLTKLNTPHHAINGAAFNRGDNKKKTKEK